MGYYDSAYVMCVANQEHYWGRTRGVMNANGAGLGSATGADAAAAAGRALAAPALSTSDIYL